MKRSEINKALKSMEKLINQLQVSLPPFCHFTPQQWEEKGTEYQEVYDTMLGWDITDFGLGKFSEIGFSLITLRNGKLNDERYPKTYAEKLLMLEEKQSAPMHFHWSKMEDIINRGGGDVVITVYNAAADESFADTDVTIQCDGKKEIVPAGTKIILAPGESITIYPYMYHDFYVPEGKGAVLLGEVSMCNDDHKDNRFYEAIGRFPTIVEDEVAYRLLCTEYEKK